MKKLCLCALLCASFALPVHADGPKDNVIDNVRRIPPPGVPVPEADRQELEQGLAALGREIDALNKALKSKPALLELLPDIEIYHKAVRYALTYEEFFKPDEIRVGKELLKQGRERAAQFADVHSSSPSWPHGARAAGQKRPVEI